MNHDDELLMVCLERRLVAAHIADELRERGGGVVIALIREVGIDPEVIADILLGFGERFGDIDGWRLLVPLGEGSSATVWLGERDGIRAAIKVVRIQDAGDAARLAREIDAASRVSHPRVIAMLASGTFGGLPYLVFPYVPGGDVEFRLKREGRLDEPTALRMMHDAAEGLEAIHASGLLHRDLKPANLLIDADGHVQIADLGLARGGDERLTRTGAILGTPGYMAPEQARGVSELTEAIDIYAMGACLFACCTGRPPFIGGTPWEIVAKVAKESAPDPREFAPQIGGQARAIIRCCLARDSAGRYESAQELREDLACAIAGEALRHAGRYKALSAPERMAVEIPAQARSPSGPLRAALLAGVILIIGYAVGYVMRPTVDPQASRTAVAELEQRVADAEREKRDIETAADQGVRSLDQIQSEIAHETLVIRELEKQIHSAKLAVVTSAVVKPTSQAQSVVAPVPVAPVEPTISQTVKSTSPTTVSTVKAPSQNTAGTQRNTPELNTNPRRDEVFFSGAVYVAVRDITHNDLVILSDQMGVIRQSRRTGVTVTSNPVLPWRACWPDVDEWVGDPRVLDMDISGEILFSAYGKRGYLGTLSVDQGATWGAIAVPDPTVDEMWQARLLADGETLIAWSAGTAKRGFYQSSDQGLTWNRSRTPALSSSVVVGNSLWFAEAIEGGLHVVRGNGKLTSIKVPLVSGDSIITLCGVGTGIGDVSAAVALTANGRFISITDQEVKLYGSLPRYIIQQRPVALAVRSGLDNAFAVLTASGAVYVRDTFSNSSLDEQGMVSCPYAIRNGDVPFISWDADICQIGLEEGLWRHSLLVQKKAGDDALPPWPRRQAASTQFLTAQRMFEGSCLVLATGAGDVRDIAQIDGKNIGILSGIGLVRFALDGKDDQFSHLSQIIQGSSVGSFASFSPTRGNVVILGGESNPEFVADWNTSSDQPLYGSIYFMTAGDVPVVGRMMEGPGQVLPDGRLVSYGMMQENPGYWHGQISGSWAHVDSGEAAIRCIAATPIWAKFFGWNVGEDFLRVYPRLDTNVGMKPMKVDSVSSLVGGLILQRTAVEGDLLWIAGHDVDHSGRLGQMNNSGQVVWAPTPLPRDLQAPRLRLIPLGDRRRVLALSELGSLWLTQDSGRTWQSCAVKPVPKPMSPMIRFVGKSDGLIFVDMDDRLVAMPISDVVASAVEEAP